MNEKKEGVTVGTRSPFVLDEGNEGTSGGEGGGRDVDVSANVNKSRVFV